MANKSTASSNHQDHAVEVFDQVAHGYEEAFDHVPAQVQSLKWIISQLPPHSKVVDVGCGTGRPACSMLVEANHDVLGVDITPSMIELARERVPEAKFEVADGRTWKPARDGELDGVVSYFSFLCGVTQADIRAFFPRAYAWLRPGGLFVFGTSPVEGEQVEIRWMGTRMVVSSLSAENTLQAIKDAGLVVEKVESAVYKPKFERTVHEGLCEEGDLGEEQHLFVYCRKPE